MNQIDKLKEEYCNLLNEYQVNAEDWDCFPELGWSWIIQNFTPKEEMTKMLDRVEKEESKNDVLNQLHAFVCDMATSEQSKSLAKEDCLELIKFQIERIYGKKLQNLKQENK